MKQQKKKTTCRRWGGHKAPLILYISIRCRWVLALGSGRFISEEHSRYPLNRGWIRPRTGMKLRVKRKTVALPAVVQNGTSHIPGSSGSRGRCYIYKKISDCIKLKHVWK
jgi:hypothetical protein